MTNHWFFMWPSHFGPGGGTKFWITLYNDHYTEDGIPFELFCAFCHSLERWFIPLIKSPLPPYWYPPFS